MKVRHLIAEQLVIELVWPKRLFDSAGENAHFVEVRATFGVGKLAQFRGMAARDQDAVALIRLPRAEQRDGMRERPDHLFRGGIEVVKLLTKGAVGVLHVGL